MRFYFKRGISILSAALLLSPSSFAFQSPLSERAVREAYFLGQRSDQKLRDFLKDYSHPLQFPKTGPFISEVQLLTPFAQVVEVSSQNTVGYSAQQAWKDYQARGDVIRVRVRLELTNTYSGVASQEPSRKSGSGDSFSPRPTDFWKSFDFALQQGEKVFDPVSVDGEPFYGEDGTFIGDYVWLKYVADDVASSEISVEVSAPDGQHVTATFNLSSLR